MAQRWPARNWAHASSLPAAPPNKVRLGDPPTCFNVRLYFHGFSPFFHDHSEWIYANGVPLRDAYATGLSYVTAIA